MYCTAELLLLLLLLLLLTLFSPSSSSSFLIVLLSHLLPSLPFSFPCSVFLLFSVSFSSFSSLVVSLFFLFSFSFSCSIFCLRLLFFSFSRSFFFFLLFSVSSFFSPLCSSSDLLHTCVSTCDNADSEVLLLSRTTRICASSGCRWWSWGSPQPWSLTPSSQSMEWPSTPSSSASVRTASGTTA